MSATSERIYIIIYSLFRGRQLSAMGREGVYAEDRTDVYGGDSGTGSTATITGTSVYSRTLGVLLLKLVLLVLRLLLKLLLQLLLQQLLILMLLLQCSILLLIQSYKCMVLVKVRFDRKRH